ncbi:MAG: hypothetical protein JO281_02740 [Pseudonocardiales bacterium]|nr:hypothetical protein [Pseudonocardiales bacterium]
MIVRIVAPRSGWTALLSGSEKRGAIGPTGVAHGVTDAAFAAALDR